MKTRIIHIGNSQGVRIPKALLAECKLDGEVELEARNGCLVIRPAHAPREGWDAAFSSMVENKDDVLLDGETSTRWDDSEWEW